MADQIEQTQKIKTPPPLHGASKRGAVKKNVAAIHISGKLSLLQRKLSNVLLLNAYDNLIEKPSHRIDARTLITMIGYNSNDMDTLREALRSLAETVAEWDMLNAKGKQEWGVSSLLSYAKLSEGVCEYAYSPVLAEKLYDPKIFALINLNIQKRFSSGHALALYENCYRFVRTGSTGWWELDLFLRLMGLEDSAYYQVFKHLNAKVIKPAVAEVNKASNIMITPEFRKEGRAVSHIRFVISENDQLAMFGLDDGNALRNTDTYKRLREMGVSDRLARAWYSEHGEDYVREKLKYVEGRVGGIRGSAAQYLSAAIRDDYQGKPSDPVDEAKIATARAKEEAVREEETAKEVARRDEKRLRLARMAVVQEYLTSLTPRQRQTHREAYHARIEYDLDRREFGRKAWDSPLNASGIIAYFDEVAPGVFDGVE